MLSRRSFLVSSVTTMGLAGFRSFAVEDGQSGPKGVLFRLGMAGGTYWKTRSEEGVVAMLDEIASLDVHYLSVKDWHLPFDSTDAQIAAFKEKCRTRSIEPYAVGPVYGDCVDAFRKAFEVARKLGAEILVGVPFERRSVGGKSVRCENRKLGEELDGLCAEYDIRFAIHNHGPDAPELFPDAKSMSAFLDGLSPRMGMCLDVGHEFRFGGNPAAAIRQHKSRLFDVHIKNVTAPSKAGVAAEFPRGKMDLPAILIALREIGYSGVCAIEWEKRGKVGEDLVGLSESVGFFRGMTSVL